MTDAEAVALAEREDWDLERTLSLAHLLPHTATPDQVVVFVDLCWRAWVDPCDAAWAAGVVMRADAERAAGRPAGDEAT